MAAIEIRNVSKSFGDTPVLRNVSLDIRAGEFLTLVGASGCGKTTLLRTLAGLEFQDAGEIAIDGRPVDDLPPKQRDVAMVFQSYALYPYMTVADNIGLPLTMRRLNAWQRLPLVGRFLPRAADGYAQIDRDVRAVADSLAIAHLLSRRPAQLSGGQRQRVALARAMVRQPKAFLMDEPLSNLDAKLRIQARAEIAELHRRLGTTFVYVTHDQAEAMTMSSRVAVMMSGELRQVAPPQTIYDDPANLDVARFIGTPEINVLSGTVRADGGLSVHGTTWPLAVEAAPETKVSVGVRPEAWLIQPASGRAHLAGKVRHLELLGSETLVHVATDQGGTVVARVDPVAGSGLRLGQPLGLAADLGRVLVFGQTGDRITTRPIQQAPRMAEAAHG